MKIKNKFMLLGIALLILLLPAQFVLAGQHDKPEEWEGELKKLNVGVGFTG